MKRRHFLKTLGCGALGGAALTSGFDRFLLANAVAANAAPTDYKALVCIFLLGGNDANNMLVPLDPAEYASYAAIRGSLALTQAELLAIQPSRNAGRYGLHPSLSRLHTLWQQGKLGVAANVGSLVEPLTRQQYQTRAAGIPYQLFSHSDQQQSWQTANASAPSQTGWGGQMAELLLDTAGSFPPVVSVAGLNAFCRGRRSKPLVIPPAPAELNKAFILEHPGDIAPASTFRTILEQGGASKSPLLVRDISQVIASAVTQSEALSQDPLINTAFPANNSLANQLKQVAKLIKFAPNAGLQRQVFFCSLGGFDTHNNQGAATGNHADLLTDLSEAMGAFYDATVELGVASQVTTFTLSDFNRTLKPGGSGADIGTDHAWGGHHFILGDAVAGGELYGDFPIMALDGPNDADRGAGARGRWIPTLAVDQYAATLASWFGVQSGDLPLVFPNLGNFGSANLGFFR